MDALNKVNVVIGGEIITLVSGEDADYMQRLARYIDTKLDDMKAVNSNAVVNERTRALFIAANIADDYFKAQDKLLNLKGEHEKFIVELGRMQEENFLLTQKIRELQDKINQQSDEARKAQAYKPPRQQKRAAPTKQHLQLIQT